MTDLNLSDELERRLDLLEDPESDESVLGDLPWRDVALAIAGIAVMAIVLLVWAYPR